MGKKVVLNCDLCGEWDTPDNPVASVTVCGPRMELCRTERVRVMVSAGIDEAKAVAYCAVYEERQGKKGTNPTLESIDLVDIIDDVVGGAEQPPQEATDLSVDVEAPAADDVASRHVDKKRR